MLNLNAERNYIKFIILAAFISFLFFLYNIYGTMPIIALGMLVLVLPILFCKGENVFLIYVFLSPFVGMIKFQGDTSAILSYCIFCFNIIYLIRRRYKFMPAILMLHILCVFLSAVINSDLSLFLKIIRFALFIEFIYCFYSENKNNTVYLWYLIKAYIAGVLLNGIYGIIFLNFNGYNLVLHVLSGIKQDRNGFSVLCAIAICFALMDFLYNKSIINYFIIAMLSIMGILTKSRTFLIVLVLSIALYIVSLLFSKKRMTALKFLVVFFVFAFFFWSRLQLVLQPVMERYYAEDVVTGNGRTVVWTLYLTKVFSSPSTALLGCGSTVKYLGTIANQVEHNTYVEAIFNIGIIGTVTLIGVLISLFKSIVMCFEVKKINVCTFIPIIIIAIAFLSLSVLYSLDINMPIVLSFIVISLFSRESRNDNIYSMVDTHNCPVC